MSVLLYILQLFPLLLATVQQIENVVKVAKAGPAKLQLVTSVVKSAYEAEKKTPMVSQEQMVPLIQSVTAAIVTFYNVTGAFQKSA